MVAAHPNELVRDQYLMQVADRCRVEPDRLRRMPPAGRRPVRSARGHVAPGRRRGRRAGPGEGPIPVAVAGPELEALRLAVHRPEAVADRLELVLFAHPLAQACFEALLGAPPPSTTPSRPPTRRPRTCSSGWRSRTPKPTPTTSWCDWWSGPASGPCGRYRPTCARPSPAEQAGFAPTVSWLKLTLEALRAEDAGGQPGALEAEQRLVGWLVARDQAEQQTEATG